MRRALVGIVPHELLNRKRKAYVARGPMAVISTEWTRFVEMSEHMISSSLEIIEATTFLEVLQKARHGQEVPTVTVMRTLGIESWLANLNHRRILVGNEKDLRDSLKGLAPTAISAEKN